MKKSEYSKMALLQKGNWWYASRRVLCLQLIKKFAKKSGKPEILEIGCGTGPNLGALAALGNATGIDLSKTAVAHCKRLGFQARVGSALSLPFGQNSFDVVVIMDVLEHLDNDSRAFAQALRVLRKGGIMVLSVPAYQWLFSYHDRAIGHRRRYTKNSLIRLASGNTPEFASYIFSFALFPAALFRLFKSAGGTSESDALVVPWPFNNALLFLSGLELRLILSGVSLPFGTSVFCVIRKKA